MNYYRIQYTLGRSNFIYLILVNYLENFTYKFWDSKEGDVECQLVEFLVLVACRFIVR